MKDRELAKMQVANDIFLIIEKKLDDEDAVQNEFRQQYLLRQESFPPQVWGGRYVEIAWWAMENETNIVGFGSLSGATLTPSDTVWLWAYVTEPRRGLGLGKLLMRLGTDLAIRYRKREILTAVPSMSAPALHILDIEDFEIDKARSGEFSVLRKELKWV